jgi:hypothetical protein
MADVMVTDQRAADLLSLLREAVRAQVELYNTLRAIEMQIFDGMDVNGLDDAVSGLAFNVDQPEDAEAKITLEDAQEVLGLVEDEEEEDEEEEGDDDES